MSSVTINCSDSMEPFYLFKNMDDFKNYQNDIEDGKLFLNKNNSIITLNWDLFRYYNKTLC